MGPDWIKIRVDDNLGATRKMSPDTYQAVISRGPLRADTHPRGSPWLWDRIGQAYMCAIPGHFNDEPVNCLRVRVQSDEQLLDSALRGLPRFVHRDALHQDPGLRAARAAVGRRALRA